DEMRPRVRARRCEHTQECRGERDEHGGHRDPADAQMLSVHAFPLAGFSAWPRARNIPDSHRDIKDERAARRRPARGGAEPWSYGVAGFGMLQIPRPCVAT